MPETGSPAGHLNVTDWRKIGKGALIALGGALLAYLSEQVIPGLESNDLAWLAPLASVLVNMAQKWVTNTQGR